MLDFSLINHIYTPANNNLIVFNQESDQLLDEQFLNSSHGNTTKEMHSIQSKAKAKAKPHPRTMAKQELGEEEINKKMMEKETKNRPNKKDVIITVYVESPPTPSDSHQKKTDPIKKIKPNNQNPRKPHQSGKTRIYDRRAQLLAYSQELRAGNSQQVQWPKNGSRPRLIRVGGKRLTTPVRIRRTKGRCRYQRLVPEVDISCSPKCTNAWKKKATGPETNSNILRKFRYMLRGISCSGWRSNKGSKVDVKECHVV